MGGHGIHHAFRRITVMTGSAIVDDAGMIKRRRYEATGGMANTTILVGRDMADFFRRGESGIVTG